MTGSPESPKGPTTDVLDIAGGIALVVLFLTMFDTGPAWLSVLTWPALVVIVLDLTWLFAVRMPRWRADAEQASRSGRIDPSDSRG
jgi:hypothetical protein